MSTACIVDSFKDNPLCTGVTISGGDPLYQMDAAIELAQAAHEEGKSVMVYTGFTLEEIRGLRRADELLQTVDIIVDGPFIESEKDLTLPFRGSRNQRIMIKGKDF